LVRGNDVLLTTTVLLEAEWVLRSRYGASRQVIHAGLRRLIDLDRLTVDRPSVADHALDWFEAGMDLADAFHLASSAAATEFATLDRRLARRATRLGAKPPVRVP
jgi:predicted nucleic-acid-binding protein